jgi:hypothetical protein
MFSEWPALTEAGLSCEPPPVTSTEISPPVLF